MRGTWLGRLIALSKETRLYTFVLLKNSITEKNVQNIKCLNTCTGTDKLTDEYLAEYANGRQSDTRSNGPQSPSVPEFGQYPVDVVLFFHGHRSDIV